MLDFNWIHEQNLTLISPEDEDDGYDQSQHAQGQQDAQSDDGGLVGGGASRPLLDVKLKLISEDFRELGGHGG